MIIDVSYMQRVVSISSKSGVQTYFTPFDNCIPMAPSRSAAQLRYVRSYLRLPDNTNGVVES